jgi:hypothetical protein
MTISGLRLKLTRMGAGFFACPPVCGVTFWPPKSDKDKPIENGLKCSER